MTLEELLTIEPENYTDEMIDRLAQLHADLHARFKNGPDEEQMAEIAGAHEQVVRKWLSLGKRHAMRDGLDEAMPSELARVSENTIPEMMDEYNEFHRQARACGVHPELQRQYQEFRREMEQNPVGIMVGWLDELDGDKAKFYQTRAAEAVPAFEEAAPVHSIDQAGRYSLQLSRRIDFECECTMKFQVGDKYAAYELYLPSMLRSVEDNLDASLREAGERILAALKAGQTFRGRYMMGLGRGAELDIPIGKIQRDEGEGNGENADNHVYIALDAGRYSVAHAFDGENSARYELSGGKLGKTVFVVRDVEIHGQRDRVWVFSLSQSKQERDAGDFVKLAVAKGDWLTAPITKYYEDKEDGKWYIEYEITDAVQLDTFGTRPTLEFLRKNVSSVPVPLLYGHVVNLPGNLKGKVIERKMIDAVLWSRAMVSKASIDEWTKINDGTLDGVSQGFNGAVYAPDPENPGGRLITDGVIVEDSLTAIPSNDRARIGAAYTSTRGTTATEENNKEKRDVEQDGNQSSREDCDMNAEVQKAVKEAMGPLAKLGKMLGIGKDETEVRAAEANVPAEQEGTADGAEAPSPAETGQAAIESGEAPAEAAPEAPDFKALVKAEVEAVFAPIKALFEKLQQAFEALVGKLEANEATATATRAAEAEQWTDERAEILTALKEVQVKFDKIVGLTPDTRAAEPAPRPRADQTPPADETPIGHERRIMAGSAPPPGQV